MPYTQCANAKKIKVMCSIIKTNVLYWFVMKFNQMPRKKESQYINNTMPYSDSYTITATALCNQYKCLVH